MFDFTSRYARQELLTYLAPDGREITYARRRFLPAGETLPLLAQVRLAPHERLDLFTFRTLGDPLQYWRIADANNAMNPFDLEDDGQTLRVPLPQP
jgi:hypothetical protein